MKLSEEETELLWGCSPERGAEKLLHKYGVSLAMVTMGEEGALLSTEKARCRVICPEVHPIDTTGAGDIFGGSALARFLELKKPISELNERDLEWIGNYAVTAASLSTEHQGGIPSIPSREAVMRRLG